MALPSNRSSSPSMISGRTSPTSRNSEVGNPVRRSFSGNPFSKPSIVANPRSFNPVTPANSPSDYPRRNSVSKECILSSRDNEEKENGKDQNPKLARVRSPTVGKSTKHFMSPTISAASKIAVSPKKKILGDRNEPVRSSLSFSGMKSSSLHSVNPNPEAVTAVETDANLEIVPISDSTIEAPPPKSSKTVRFAGFDVISGSYDDSESQVESVLTEESKNRYDSNPEEAMAVETDTKPEIAPVSNSAIAAAPPKAPKTVRFSDFEVDSVSNNDLESQAKTIFTEELDCVNLDPSFKISPVSSSMVVPLDADPLMPPYDPKTNYLSPRPQFLHYRPNRRIERYLSKEPDGSKLEDLFSSVNISESELTEEAESEHSQKESDEASSNELPKEEEGEEEEDEEEELQVSEPCPIEVKESYKPQFSKRFKIGSLLLLLLVACCSICVVNLHDPNILERASLLPMDSDPSEIYEFAKTNFNVLVGKLPFSLPNKNVLVGKLEVWHENSISFISDVFFNIRGAPPLIYLNQTDFFFKDVNVVEQCLVSHQTMRRWEEENNNLDVMEAMKGRESDIEPIEREVQNEEEEEESFQEIEVMKGRESDIEPVEREGQNEEEEEEEEEELLQEIEVVKERETDIEPVEREGQSEEEEEEEESLQEIEAKDPRDIVENDEASVKSASGESLQEIEISDPEDTEENDETSAKSTSDKLDEEEDAQEKEANHWEEAEENYYEVSSSAHFVRDQISEPEPATGKTEEENNDSLQQSNTDSQYQSPPASHSSEFPSDVEENGGSIELTGAATDGISGDFAQNMAVRSVSLLLLSLIISAALLYARRAGSKPSVPAAVEEQQPLLKEKKTSQSPVEEEESVDDDMAGESCSSETGSFQHSSMRGGGGGGGATKGSSESHSHSHGRKTRKNSRRESLASSSLDDYSVSASPSYGSFTTYERIPIKHGNGEEEAITPVRRSSRIRKQYLQ